MSLDNTTCVEPRDAKITRLITSLLGSSAISRFSQASQLLTSFYARAHAFYDRARPRSRSSASHYDSHLFITTCSVEYIICVVSSSSCQPRTRFPDCRFMSIVLFSPRREKCSSAAPTIGAILRSFKEFIRIYYRREVFGQKGQKIKKRDIGEKPKLYYFTSVNSCIYIFCNFSETSEILLFLQNYTAIMVIKHLYCFGRKVAYAKLRETFSIKIFTNGTEKSQS